MKSELSKEQQAVATAGVDDHLLVLAGPGTGKTHALIYRLLHLIDTENLIPTSEILVLSFSRAAVAEIRERLGGLAGQGAFDDIRFLNIRTFDSFATRLLSATDETIDLSGTSYDGRIRRATQRLSAPESNASDLVGGIRHLVVDEIQDLVGVRARLVQQLIGRISGGFTLLGDPAQAIFDYLVERPTDGPTSIEFLDWIRHYGARAVTEISLSRNYRIASESADVASAVRPLVLDPPSDTIEVYDRLRNVIVDLPGAGSVAAPDKSVLNPRTGRVALLCRSNEEALFVSSRLIQQGIQCVVPPSADEVGLPPWIGRIFSAYSDSRISRSIFLERWQKYIGSNYRLQPDTAWGLLKGLESNERPDLDLDVLRSRLRRGVDWTFDSESHLASGYVVATTIHQSKGREYDTVVVLQPKRQASTRATGAIEEARVLYVAATRSRQCLLRLETYGLPIMEQGRLASGPARRFGQDGQGRHFFQAGVPGDILEYSWVGKTLFSTPQKAMHVQDMIWKSLKPGTHLWVYQDQASSTPRLLLVLPSESGQQVVPLAQLDYDFGVTLSTFVHSRLPANKQALRKVMKELIVIERKTVLLPAFAENVHEPFATSGFCLGASVRGLLQID